MLFASVHDKRRTTCGAQTLEFAAAVTVLIIAIILPLLDFGVIPVHWMLSQEIVSNYARKLTLCKSFSQALAMLDADSSLQNQLSRVGGVKPQAIKCFMAISRLQPPFETFTTDTPRTIPSGWLPATLNSPCSYEIKLSALLEFDPLILVNFYKVNIPGLTKPFNCVIEAKVPWENYECDPITNQYFINE
jgi:hypothetical protein